MRAIVTLKFVFLWLQTAKPKNERKIIVQSFVNMLLYALNMNCTKEIKNKKILISWTENNNIFKQ
jgi:hypothetical protein